ncbi:HOOK domain containing protein [Nitzschia inconspicua]|uniref:HOOK domain containing protein n=1 Tax=Nitzschia inconspicua TaxID=303405 RepID=A0A9K3Q0G3_9STRA|nr:HOOK domain containing protein [Nitzschia inconspicua]
MGDENATRRLAMVEFIGTFPTLSGAPPTEFSDLSDGVALFEVLSEIAPDHFDPTTIARHLGDNWALKSSNLRKLVRNLEYYYHEDLQKDAPASFQQISSNLGKIARTGDGDSLEPLVELVAAAAVTCPKKSEFVVRIMGMSAEGQVQMKGIIESSLQRLEEYDAPDLNDDALEDDPEMIFSNDSGAGVAASAADRGAGGALFDADHLKQTMPTDADKEELEQALLEAKRELATQKSLMNEVREDADKAQAKLRALVEDLQDRLAQRQDELISSEEELRDATTELDGLKARVGELEEEKAQLADELDVASSKAAQLHKAEATVLAYKKKLDGVGVINQQMTDLEDQAAGYLRQIMDLEAEVKKTATLQRQVDSLQKKLEALEFEKNASVDSLKNTSTEISDLKTQLAAAEKARKMFESELEELRAQQAVEHEDVVVEGFDSHAPMSAEQREKVMRMEIENKKLKEEVEALKSGGAVASTGADTAALEAEIKTLKDQLEKKTAENKKIGSDKDKLEAYTKRTLAKFQDKYLVALQECKAKLKEKQDKIEILESRSATEKTAQKREERLLSSTIYELGLAIMQNRLKER